MIDLLKLFISAACGATALSVLAYTVSRIRAEGLVVRYR